jgi:hypothetical protein
MNNKGKESTQEKKQLKKTPVKELVKEAKKEISCKKCSDKPKTNTDEVINIDSIKKAMEDVLNGQDARFKYIFNDFNISLGKRFKEVESMTIGLEETEKNTIKDLRLLQQKFESLQDYSLKLLKKIIAISVVFGVLTLTLIFINLLLLS